MVVSPVEIRVGIDPDDLDEQVTLSDEHVLDHCYIEGNAHEKQTALVHDWCVQWAEAGRGFAYFVPYGYDPLTLLYALPEDRLDDVLWIDFRDATPDEFDLPEGQSVRIGPLDDCKAPMISETFVKDSRVGRIDDIIGAITDTSLFHWNRATILADVLAALPEETDARLIDCIRQLSYVHGPDDLEPVRELLPEHAQQTVTRQLQRALQRDDDAIKWAQHLLQLGYDPFPRNPLLEQTSCSFQKVVYQDRIVLVTGALPDHAGTFGNQIDQIGSRLLIRSVLRRLWESLQAHDDRPLPYPVILDDIEDLLWDDARLLRECLEHWDGTPLALVINGPDTDELRDEVSVAINEHAGTRLIFTENAGENVRKSLMTGGGDPLERELEQQQTTGITDPELCWVYTDRDGLLSDGTAHDWATAIPTDAPERRHTDAAVEQAIERSLIEDGTRSDLVDIELELDE